MDGCRHLDYNNTFGCFGEIIMSGKGLLFGILLAITIPLMITLITQLPSQFSQTNINILALIPIGIVGIISYLIWK